MIDRRTLLIGAGTGVMASKSIARTATARGPGIAQLRIMTYNIRLDTPVDGPNRWAYRRAGVVAQIDWFHPDIFGLQEVVFSQKQDMIADLPDYRLIGAGRDDGHDAGESSPLGYRIELFDLLGSGTFWLSPTPERPSKGWDAAFPRVATWVRLRTKRGGKTILAVNTHWDHIGIEARRQSGLLLARWLAENRDRVAGSRRGAARPAHGRG